MEEGGSRSQGVAVPVEEAEEPSLTRGPGSTKPHSLLLHVENGRRAGGGGEGGSVEERIGGQLVGSANRYGNSHLIDM